jgi:hypothetical protein
MILPKTCSKVALSCLALLFCALPLRSQAKEYLDQPSRRYDIRETGLIAKLGIEVRITPQTDHQGGVTGFLVEATYKDPAIRSGETISLLQPKFFAATCEPYRRSKDYGAYSRTNDFGTTFRVTLHQGCKDAKPGIAIPYLEAKVLCSNLAAELRRLEAIQSKKIFDIVPTGFYRSERTITGKLVDAGREAYEVYSVISDILLVFTVITVAEGAATVGAFIIEAAELVAESSVKGYVEGKVVEYAFDYVDSNYGMQVRFKLTGWDLVCRIGRHHFHRDSLAEGELVRCPHGDAEAYVHFQ